MLYRKTGWFYRIIKLIHREHNQGATLTASVTDAYGNPLEGIWSISAAAPRWVTPASKRMLR